MKIDLEKEACRLSMCFFFQAEDGIRDYKVTGVQTCALPIYDRAAAHLLRPAARRSGEHGRTPLQCVCRRTITGVPDLGPRLRSLWTATGAAHRAAGIGDRLFDFRIRQRSLVALRVSIRARVWWRNDRRGTSLCG